MAGNPSAAAKNAMLNGLGAVALYVSAHTGDPGSTGTNEATGGSPAYARKAITWGSASAGSMTTTSSFTFDVPAGTYTFVGLWSASTGGTYYYKISMSSQTFSGQSTLPIASITIDQSLVTTA